MITKIATVAVYVDDQKKAKNFWTDKVGFEVFRETEMSPGMNWLEVGPKGAQSALVVYPKKLMPEWQAASIVFLTDDVEATYATLVKNGVQFDGGLQKMEYGTFARFKDDDGNLFLIKGAPSAN